MRSVTGRTVYAAEQVGSQVCRSFAFRQRSRLRRAACLGEISSFNLHRRRFIYTYMGLHAEETPARPEIKLARTGDVLLFRCSGSRMVADADTYRFRTRVLLSLVSSIIAFDSRPVFVHLECKSIRIPILYRGFNILLDQIRRD